MALTISLRIVMRRIGCILIIIMSSAQAIDYDVYRNDVIFTPLENNVIFTSRDFLEELILIAPMKNASLQEATEYLLHFGALIRTQILDIFGNLLYIYYDDFSMAEAEALHKMYQEMFERRYDIFNLVPGILKNAENMRPSKICAAVYAHAEPCLRSSANMCRRIRKQHDLPYPEDLDTPTINVTHAAYHLSKISKQYPKGFSPAAVLKLLQREVLTITPALLSGLLYNVRYDGFDDDVRLAENKLVQYFHEVELITKNSSNIELQPLSTQKLKKLNTVNLFLKYYLKINAKKFPDDNLRRYSSLITKRIADDIGTINENINLLGNVYEKHTINVEYLFDLVLPDDTLDDDVIEAKKYLVRKLNEFNVTEKYLKVQKFQQITPDQLTMEITDQLKDIRFAEKIATSLRMHAKFWRRSIMIENLDELLELFDAYENLRQIPQYYNIMQNIDKIRENLWDQKNVTVEILCNTPRACLRIGLQLVLQCKYINPEIKNYIKTFLVTSNMCVNNVKKSVDYIPIKFLKQFAERKNAVLSTERITKTYDQSKATTDSFESESMEEVSGKPNIPLEDSSESIRITTTVTSPTTAPPINNQYEYPSLTTTTNIIDSEEETSTGATTITASSVTTTITLPTTTTTTEATTIAIILPTTITSTTSTSSPTSIITTEPTSTTTILPTTTITKSPTTASTSLPTTTTTTELTTTTTILPTTTTTESSTTTSTSSPTTITTTEPTSTTTILPTTTTESSTTTSISSPTTITTTEPTSTTTILPTTTTESSTATSTSSPTTTTTTEPTSTTTILPTTTTESSTATSTASPTTTTTTEPTSTTTILPTATTESSTATSTASPTTTTTTEPTSTTTILPTTTTTELPTTTSTSSPTTTTTTEPISTTTILPTTTTAKPPTMTFTTSPTVITTTESTTTRTILPTATTTKLSTTSTSSPTITAVTKPRTITTILPTTTTTELPTTTSTSSPTTTITTEPTTVTTKSSTMTTTAPKTTEQVPITEESRSSIASTATSCETNECTTDKPIETTTLTTTKSVVTSETIRTTSSALAETTTVTTELSATPVTRGDDCKRFCSDECRSKSESYERSETSCETDCDYLIEDCNEESPETSSGCTTDIDKNCECVFKEDKSIECATLCPSDENAACNQKPNDCTTSNTSSPTNELTIELTRQHDLCEIRDPHRRRQIKRLAKMRAISVNSATTDAISSGIRPSRIATKKLYNLLASKLPHSKSEKSNKIVEYLLKKPLNSLKEVGNQKHKEQQEQIHRLRKNLMNKLRRKKLKSRMSIKEINQS